MEKTHWKKLVNPDYLGSYSLNPGQEIIATIKEIKREDVIGSGGKKKECTVAYFVEDIKKMVINRLNSKTISNIYKTPYIEDWVGKKIQIFSTPVDAFGETVDALRIRPFVPNKPLPILPTEGKHYTAAVKHLKDGNPIADLEKHYTIPEETLVKLKADANII